MGLNNAANVDNENYTSLAILRRAITFCFSVLIFSTACGESRASSRLQRCAALAKLHVPCVRCWVIQQSEQSAVSHCLKSGFISSYIQ